MENYPKIAVKNVCVVDVCFRRAGRLYNEGKIIVDIDSYDFAGFLTDDVIIGLYEDEGYFIRYFYKTYRFDEEFMVGEEDAIRYETDEYLLELSKDFKRTILKEDFVNNKISFQNGTEIITLSFNTIISEPKEIEKALNHNMDLLMPKK